MKKRKSVSSEIEALAGELREGDGVDRLRAGEVP